MTLENIYTISQIVATFVVAASLIAILIESYQTNKIAKADLTLQVWMATGAMQLSLADSPEKAEFFHRALRPARDAYRPGKIAFEICAQRGAWHASSRIQLAEAGPHRDRTLCHPGRDDPPLHAKPCRAGLLGQDRPENRRPRLS